MKMKNLKIVIILLLCVPSAMAITETYTQKERFLALSGSKLYTDPYPTGTSSLLEFESNLITFSTPSGSSLNFNQWTNSFPGVDLAINGVENLNVEFSFAVASLGFDIEEDSADSTFSIKLYRNDSLVETVEFDTNSTTQFIGVWSESTFDRAEIREINGNGTNEFFGAFYGGTNTNRDVSANVPALACQLPLLAAYSFSTGAAFFALPPFDLGFDFAAHTANFGLKFCKPYAFAPADMIHTVNDTTATDPNSFDACHKSFDHERQHSYFTALFGIPIQYDYDWGDLGTPQIVHQNTDVEVYMLEGLRPPMADSMALSSLLQDEMASGGIHVGCNGIRATSDTGHDCPFAENRKINLKVGRNTLSYRFDVKVGALDLVYIPVPKFPKGTKNKALLDFGLDLLFEVTGTVIDVVFLDGWRFGNFEDRKQHVVVYDTEAPEISKVNTIDFNGDGVINGLDLQFIDDVVIEADEIGGVSASRFQTFISSMYNTSDACDRTVSFVAEYPDEALRVFWPVSQTGNDQSFTLTWKASDPGPNYQGLPNETTITQRISVVDTRPPIIQSPMDIVELTDASQVTLDLGQPLVFDLVDINPTIENDAVFPLSAGLHTITWTATDASGNVSTTTQSVNIKNSNIEPNALALTGNDAQDAISFEPQEITLEGFDTDGDPLNFFIEDYPENGFFVAPLYPYFIEDYRLEATTPDSEWEAFCATNPPGGDFFHAEHIRNPVYFSVLDDGTTYVIDHGYVQCQAGVNLPPDFGPRLAVFDAAGQFIAAQDRQRVPNDFYIDINSERLFTTDGELSDGAVVELDSNLNTVMRFDMFNLPDQNQVAADSGFDGSINFAYSAVMDSQGVLYVLDNRGDVHALRSDRGAQTGNNNHIRPEFINYALQTPNQGTNFDMAIDSEDNLYISMNHRVYKVSPATVDENGDFVVGELIGWMGKCTEDTAPGDQAVCDVTNERSLGYSCTDETCGGFAPIGDQPGQFNDARGVAIDKNDVLFVTDFRNFRIQRFTPEGFFAGQAESACEGNCFVLGDFGQPHDIAVNSTHFFIVDPLTNLLHISQTSPFLEIGDDYATVLYQSNNDFACVLSGDCIDTFSFSVSDGVQDPDTLQMIRSAPAVVEVEVARNFRPPFATPGIQVDALEEQATAITLDGSDPDPLDSLSYTITRQPNHGSVSHSGNQAIYTADLNYVGEDSFEFTATDGNETSAPEVIEITVQDVNDPAVIEFNLPDTVGRGFEIRLDGTLRDPDLNDTHHLVVYWGDDTAPEPEGEINMMGEMTGPILYSNAMGNGTVMGTHVFDNTGTYNTQFCVTDRVDEDGNSTAESIESCSTANLVVEDMIDLTIEYTGPDALIRGQSDNYIVTITNREPDSGTGLTAINVVFTAAIDDVIITSSPTGCSIAGSEINCPLGNLTPGESTEITIPMIVPGDTGDQIEVLSELNVSANQIDITESNLTFIRVPLVADADLIIGGNAMGQLTDDADDSLGDGVCEGANTGVCNLRAAIMEANQSSQIESIALGNAIYSLSLTDTVTPDSGYGDLDVEQSLLIVGNGPENTIIDAAGIDRVFDVLNGATLELQNLSIVGGLTSAEVGFEGAGIRVNSNSRLVLRNVKLSNNDASGAGGAIFNHSTLNDSLTLRNTTINANSASSGAGITSNGGGTLKNVTISANQSASGKGGGLQLTQGQLTLTQVTITANSAPKGGGMAYATGANLILRNSLIGDNTADDGPDCFNDGGSVTSQGGNLVSELTDCSLTLLSSDKTGVSTGVLPLTNNGGSTETHALRFTSQARDNGIAEHCSNLDQRRFPRNIDGNGDGLPACDSGAFEADGIEGDIIFQNSFE